MSNEVEVKYGDDAAGTASRLLSAARALDLETSVVRTTSDNVFLVPEEVADEAGFSYDIVELDEAPEDDEGSNDTDDQDDATEVPAGTLEERVTWVTEGEDESERTKRANAVHLHETEVGDLDEAELEQLNSDLTVAVHGQAPAEEFDASGYKGKGLDEALTKRGLSTEGKADEKRARLAEFENTKE